MVSLQNCNEFDCIRKSSEARLEKRETSGRQICCGGIKVVKANSSRARTKQQQWSKIKQLNCTITEIVPYRNVCVM